MASAIQVFGTLKCKDTQKAIRFFKDRNIKFQFIDLNEKKISKGELNSISIMNPIETLIDTDGKEYKSRNLAFIIHDVEEELLEHPLLFKTPIVRMGSKSFIGNLPDKWKTLI